MRSEVDSSASAACCCKAQDDPLPLPTGFRGMQLRSGKFHAWNGFYELVDERPGAQAMVGRGHIDLQFAWNLVGLEAPCSGLAVPVGHDGQSFGAVGELAGCARYG